MSRFISIRITGNISNLDKAFDPNDDNFNSAVPINELIETWSAIDSEYTELMDTGKMKDTLKDTSDKTVLDAKYLLIAKIVEVLRIIYHQELVDILREEGIEEELDPSNPEQYYRTLNRMLTLSKTLLMESKIKEAQIKSRFSESDEIAEPIDEGDNLRDILNIIRADAHYFVEAEKITVYDFAWMYQALMKKLRTKTKTDG